MNVRRAKAGCQITATAHATHSAPGSQPESLGRAYAVPNAARFMTRPQAAKSQPTGLPGRREPRTAPTVAKTSPTAAVEAPPKAGVANAADAITAAATASPTDMPQMPQATRAAPGDGNAARSLAALR